MKDQKRTSPAAVLLGVLALWGVSAAYTAPEDQCGPGHEADWRCSSFFAYPPGEGERTLDWLLSAASLLSVPAAAWVLGAQALSGRAERRAADAAAQRAHELRLARIGAGLGDLGESAQ